MQYFVNTNPWPGQQHEVHKEGCHWMPSSKKALGNHLNCQSAVAQAKIIYLDADGCKYCCPACHTN